MNTATPKTLTGVLIRGHRLELQLTQKQLATLVDVDPITVSRWERGATLPADLQRVRLARVFSIHPNELLEDAIASEDVA